MDPEDEEKTAFITNEGTFCYTVMPFGLKNAGATYQRLMDNVFQHQRGRNLEVYVDDVLVKSKSSEEHLNDLTETFNTLRRFNIKLNPMKCVFGASSGKFLGFLVSAEGIHPNPDKIHAIMELETPDSLKKVQQLTGRVAALSRFISKSAEKCGPIFKSLKRSGKLHWGPESQEAFVGLKGYLSNPPIMSSPVSGETLYLYLGVGEVAVSSVLIREDNNIQRPVYYVGKSLALSEKNYPPLEKLAYALIISARRLRPYFQTHLIKVVTDRPLKQVLSKPEVSGRLTKWSIELSEFDIDYVPRLAIKAQVLADFICDFTVPPQEDFIAEDEWTMYVDGASGANSSGVGVVLRSPAGIILLYAVRLTFEVTNNQAEYEALLAGLRFAVGIGIKVITVFSDSQLLVNHVRKVFESKEATLAKYLTLVRTEISRFEIFQIQHVLREGNQVADILAKYGNPHSTTIREIQKPSIEEAEILNINSDPSWITKLSDFIARGILPKNQEEQRNLKRQAIRFFLHNGILYKKSFSGISLRCLPPAAVQDVLEEVHEGICGGHFAGRTMSKIIRRQGYYWPTIQKDAENYSKKCKSCQIHGNILNQPSTVLQPIVGPWPFAIWGMDFIGPLPVSTGRRCYMLVVIDYFTKWIEAIALTKATTDAVIKFLWNNIFCRYGLPLTIITDNGAQFNNRATIDFCQNNGVALKFASVSHPQTNGQAEAANKQILNILKKRLEGKKGLWAEELSTVLWAYRTTPNQATGQSPFSLTYGAEAVTPVELMVTSGRTQEANRMEVQQLDEWRAGNDTLLQNSLDDLDETRAKALKTIFVNKEKVRRFFNKKVRPRQFQQGDLVLRKLSAARDVSGQGKLSPNWGGPFIIKNVVKSGAYKLQTYEGDDIPRTWNGNDLKLFRT